MSGPGLGPLPEVPVGEVQGRCRTWRIGFRWQLSPSRMAAAATETYDASGYDWIVGGEGGWGSPLQSSPLYKTCIGVLGSLCLAILPYTSTSFHNAFSPSIHSPKAALLDVFSELYAVEAHLKWLRCGSADYLQESEPYRQSLCRFTFVSRSDAYSGAHCSLLPC